MTNPDYPNVIGNTNAFLMHTYQPQFQDTYFYGSGMGCNNNSFGCFNPFQNSDSRRNSGYCTSNNQNPFDHPQAFQQPSAPAYGLNQMMESRRNMDMPSNNPWAQTWTPQYQQPQQNQYPTQPYVQNPFTNQIAYTYNANTAALYSNDDMFGFDKKDMCWNNAYTNPRQIPTPNIDWSNTNNMNNGFNDWRTEPQYPIQTNTTSWRDIAEKNISMF